LKALTKLKNKTNINCMKPTEIFEELKKLTNTERLTVIKASLRLIREGLQGVEKPSYNTQRKQQLSRAAKMLLKDYSAGGDLTTYTTIWHCPVNRS
jgi:hypothetical protein